MIASTFDFPAERHVSVARLTLERARRRVELGEDVVIILDSITRLARAHNTVDKGSGRTLTGGLDARAKVGDAVVTLADGTRIAVEAKNATRITLTGKEGILEELDRAMVNREASWGICISKQDAYPGEVGAFGLYGKRHAGIARLTVDQDRAAAAFSAFAAGLGAGDSEPFAKDEEQSPSRLDQQLLFATVDVERHFDHLFGRGDLG